MFIHEIVESFSTHTARYLWANSFVYSLKSDSLFLHLQHCNWHCLCSLLLLHALPRLFLLFALSISLSLFLLAEHGKRKKSQAHNNGKLIFEFDVSSASLFLLYRAEQSTRDCFCFSFCPFLFCREKTFPQLSGSLTSTTDETLEMSAKLMNWRKIASKGFANNGCERLRERKFFVEKKINRFLIHRKFCVK